MQGEATPPSNDDRSGARCRVLLYSDEPPLAKGLESLLRQTQEFDVLPTCSTVAALLERRATSPDVVLLDLTPEITFAVLRDIINDLRTARIVLWINSISIELAFLAMGLGVRGILRKDLPTDLQITCLQKVRSGELWFEKALTDRFLNSSRVELTRHEEQLVSLLAQGLKRQQIAKSLMIPEGTVRVRLFTIVPEGWREGPLRARPFRAKGPE
jgi:DNA-binding NarL/FixJ family response regulator